MILLEYHNRIIQETIQNLLESDKKEPLDIVLADFDGVQYHITTPKQDARNIVQLSISWRCIPELLKNGGSEDLKAIYGNMVQATPESGYHVTLEFDLNNVPGNKEKFPEVLSLLKRHLFAAPFKKIFQAVDSGKAPTGVTTIQYRDEEAIYIKPEQDRVLVIYSVNFRDEGDQVVAKIFLQECVEARKAVNNAPAVSYSVKDAPLELKGVPGVKETGTHSFVTFVLFKPHLGPKAMDKTINNVQIFRNHLHYHIKCSKAFLHTHMRARVDKFLQDMNKARPTASTAPVKKTMTGRTFERK
jgi:actin related protein 2/3 complex subunit 2